MPRHEGPTPGPHQQGLQEEEGDRPVQARPHQAPGRRRPPVGRVPPGVADTERLCYHRIRGRAISHQAALRHLANRWIGILRGCLTTGALSDEDLAWAHIHTAPLDTAEPGMSAAVRADAHPAPGVTAIPLRETPLPECSGLARCAADGDDDGGRVADRVEAPGPGPAGLDGARRACRMRLNEPASCCALCSALP